MPIHRIEVVVHPQSVIHSMVEMRDGSLLAQLGPPDMRMPIQIALLHPDKVDSGLPRLSPWRMPDLTFEPPDLERFPALKLARAAGTHGGGAPIVLNAANEVAVDAFLAGRLPFTGICDIVERALGTLGRNMSALTLSDIHQLDAETRIAAAGYMN